MRKVAIVARGGTNRLAPFRDKEWEIWGLPWISYPRLDVAFELHSQQFYEDIEDSWLKQEGWRKEFNRDNPNAITYCDPSRMHGFKNPREYPLEEVAKSIPIFYFENSIGYMLALAIHQRVGEIGLYGVHMFAGAEAELAAPCVAYMVGVAQGRGIKVTVAEGSPLFMSNWTHGRYGVRGGPRSKRPKIISFAGVTPYE